jgi:hypothetical protein
VTLLAEQQQQEYIAEGLQASPVVFRDNTVRLCLSIYLYLRICI